MRRNASWSLPESCTDVQPSAGPQWWNAPGLTIDLLLDVPDVAAALGVSRNQMYQLVRHGEIPAQRIGRQVKIWLSDVCDYLRRHYEPRRPQNVEELFSLFEEHTYGNNIAL